MGAFDNGLGGTAINSTYAPASNPSTATLIAELDSTQLGTANLRGSRSLNFRVNWIVGADTNTAWQLEACTSTALSAGVDIIYLQTPAGQSGQYITSHVLSQDMRLRARMNSTFTGTAMAYISAEPLF